jgi:hypothetical protein
MSEILKNKHQELVCCGCYYVARRLLQFLIHNKVKLGLGDIDWTVEDILMGLNLRSHTDARGMITYYNTELKV